MRLNFPGYLFRFTDLGPPKLILSLQIQPKTFGSPEIAGKPHSCIGGDASIFPDDFIHSGCWNMESLGEGVNAHFQRLQIFFPKDFPGVDWAHTICGHSVSPLMVINYFNVYRTIVRPSETQTPLLVNPDAVQAFTISGERLKTVSWRRLEVIENLDRRVG